MIASPTGSEIVARWPVETVNARYLPTGGNDSAPRSRRAAGDLTGRNTPYTSPEPDPRYIAAQ